MSFPEGNAAGQDMVVLDPGAPGRAASVAYSAISMDANFWHPELRAGRLEVGAGPAQLVQPLVLYGFDAHAWGRLSGATEGNGLALAFYHGDEANPNVKPSLNFRGFNLDSWQPGNEVVVDREGSVAYALAPGASVENAVYDSRGYAVSYRAGSPDGGYEARVAVLSASGAPVFGPVPSSLAADYPGATADVGWTGATYLVATAHEACGSFQPCGEDSVLVAELVPDADRPLRTRVTFGARPGRYPRRPLLASFGGRVWVSWSESPRTDGEPAGRSVMLAELGPRGESNSPPVTLVEDAFPYAGVGLSAGPNGVLLSWVELNEGDAPDNQPGAGVLVILHVDSTNDLKRLEVPITAPGYGLEPAIAELGVPRGYLVSWSGTPLNDAPDVTFLAQFECK